MFAPPIRIASISCCSLCIVRRVAGVDIFEIDSSSCFRCVVKLAEGLKCG